MNELIKNRRSVREFSGERVSDEVIMEVVRAAMQAPSAKNGQPWLIHIEKNPEVIRKMSEEFPNLKFGHNASFVLVFLMNLNAPIPVMAPQDMSACVTMALLEAEHQGLGACWGGTYPREERMNQARRVFNLYGENYVPFAIVPMGPVVNKDAYRFVDRFDEGKLV